MIALLFPNIMGVGYDTINIALHGNMMWYFALTLIFMKIIATSLTLGSGGSGGIFAPSLFMGAMLGSFFGFFVHELFPNVTATPGAYTLVAMGGLVAGTTRAPITAIIIVFELTNDYRIILPLMITCIISTIISTRLTRESIYTLKLLLRNIGIKKGIETNVMESILVKDVFTRDFTSINMSDNFSQVVNKMIRGKGPDFPVISNQGKIKGLISIPEMKQHFFESDSLKNVLIADDISNKKIELAQLNSNCQEVLEKISKFNLEGLPVVEDMNSKKLIGMIWRKDIQDAYQKEIDKREITSSLASSITMKKDEPSLHFMEGYSIIEISTPKYFTGKSIRELNIRAKYGVDVLSIKIKDRTRVKVKAIPNLDYIFNESDTIILAGEIKNINLIKNLL